ncbi:MAG: trehalase, partial [Bacteroidetes bacterium]|nr:trehalase [Bacteroidota bacterium]
WQGLLDYGHTEAAHRLIYRWLFTITSNAVNYNGTIPEKYDLVGRTHQVFVEYGNVGTDFSYITQEGFGWTNASYQIGLSLLPKRLREPLNRLIPPEWILTNDTRRR